MLNVCDLRLNLIYKSTRDGIKFENFHSKCDNMGPTITLIKSEFGKTFGGYTNLNWNKRGWISGTGKSFIFQLDYNTKHKCLNAKKEIYADEDTIQFGEDFHLFPADGRKKNYCDLGWVYEGVQGL
jgi:hypothetical protein